ncbi:ATP-dependent DNA helicase RecG [Curtanaerobium respiraculi]|uniref:ATP-dependent DNA helicase RecG n=1 Tax=Curtanaerobium respiraculi TaxID=2949669 RepID=UPI0024B34015|nr:ATP-dependent DNA helicase RecG [Curtanaerobium respiraculi]
MLAPTDSIPVSGKAAPSRLSATLALEARVDRVRGVSAARAAALARLGVRTVRDLLTHFPRRYIDMSAVAHAADAEIGDSVTVVGEVYDIKLKRTRRKYLDIVEITLVDGTGTLMVSCFRQRWLMDKLQKGDRVAVSGKVEFNYGFKRMTNPHLEKVEGGLAGTRGLIIAVHPATEKISTTLVRTLVGNALELVRGLDDPLPLGLRCRYRLYSRQAALECIHFPQTMDEAVQARRRLAYEEVLLLELHLMMRAGKRQEGEAPVRHRIRGRAVAALEKALPFELTAEQQAARDDMLRAMEAPRRAQHMILGDVGTGKTAVAAFALAAAADTGTQALMMGPTEVLAKQYARDLGPLLDAAGVSWALLTGSTDPAERARILAALSDGSVTVLLGTHALLEKDVMPRACSVVVIDEQQRFGVAQRAALAGKGPGCDAVSLTATPIPRTLALALYGDMTLSYIHERPHATRPPATFVFPHTQSGGAYEIARDALEAGQQAYVVCPLVGGAGADGGSLKADEQDAYDFARISIESEGDLDDGRDPRGALEHARYLQEKIFPGYAVEVLHGRMGSDEKRAAMDAFRRGDVQVLVATTVIEVGVDVPNATVMVVEDADRFGLAQLHQLRGRVGRGELPGRVCLISGSKAPAALSRLAAMERTSDGFELAEYDLSLRREGDILGNRQHGAGNLKLVNVMRDARIIEAAHDDARALLDADPHLAAPEHAALGFEVTCAFPDEKGAARG